MTVGPTPERWKNPLEPLGHFPAWVGRHWKRLFFAAVGLTSAGFAINHFITQDNSPVKADAPASDTFKPPEPAQGEIPALPTVTRTEWATPVPPSPTTSPTRIPTIEAPATAIPTLEAPNPLPPVVNNETAKFRTGTLDEIKALWEQSIKEGNPKVPVLKDVEYKTINNNGILILGFYIQPGETLNMPALTNGNVVKVVGSLSETGSTYNSIWVEDEKSITISYVFPSGTKWNTKEGKPVEVGDTLFTVTYLPNSISQKGMEKFGSVFKGAVVRVSFGKNDTAMGKGIESIMTDPKTGEIITLPSASLSAELNKFDRLNINPNLVGAMARKDLSSYFS